MYTIRLPKDKGLSGPLVLAEWVKQEGQSVQPSDPIAWIDTLQARIELQACATGTLLRVLAAPGCVIQPDEVLCVLGEQGQDVTRVVEGLIRAVPVAAKKVTPILMPQAGQTMEEGTLIAWKVKPGDRIEVGQVILDIETDKATMEVEATDAGRLARIVADEGQVVAVKTPVAYLAENDADVDAYLAGEGWSGVGGQGSGVGGRGSGIGEWRVYSAGRSRPNRSWRP